QLDRKQVRSRVEADDELRTLVLDGLGEAIGEMRRRDCGHRFETTEARGRPNRSFKRRRPACFWLNGGPANPGLLSGGAASAAVGQRGPQFAALAIKLRRSC